MAVLKDLIVHGRSRFINGANFKSLNSESIGAEQGIFNKLIATTLDATTATIDDLTAKNATVTALLDVQGDMHTNSWSNSNIATIDGSFYITPTSVSNDGSDVDASGYTPTGTITYSSSNFTKLSITGTFDTSQLTLNDNAHVAWPANSEVIVSGDVLVGNEWLPLGTIRGKLESQVAATNASKTISVVPLSTTLTDGQGHTPITLETIRVGINLTSGTSSVLKMRKIKVSLTSRASGSTQYPVGILLSAQGTGTGQTFIDIYGGNNARNGQSGTINGSTKTFTKPMVRLGNLEGLPKIANQTPSGWGIYTSNGFFEGAIVAKEGYIGNTGSYWTIGGGTSSGATYMYSGPSTVSATSTPGTYLGTDGFLNTASTTKYAKITGGVLTAQGAIINGALTATSLSTGNPARTSSGTGTAGTYIASDGAIYVGSNNSFTVTAAGAITAKSGTIGGWSINSSYGIYTNSKTSATSTNSGILIQKDGNIYAGAYNSTAASCPFQVTNTGVLTAVNANLKGLTIYDAGTTQLGSFTASSGNTTIKLGQEAANKFNILITDSTVSSKGPGILLRQGTNVLNEITANGMKLYLASDTTNSIAQFGETTRIGKEAEGHIKLTSDGIELWGQMKSVTDHTFIHSQGVAVGLESDYGSIELGPVGGITGSHDVLDDNTTRNQLYMDSGTTRDTSSNLASILIEAYSSENNATIGLYAEEGSDGKSSIEIGADEILVNSDALEDYVIEKSTVDVTSRAVKQAIGGTYPSQFYAERFGKFIYMTYKIGGLSFNASSVNAILSLYSDIRPKYETIIPVNITDMNYATVGTGLIRFETGGWVYLVAPKSLSQTSGLYVMFTALYLT